MQRDRAALPGPVPGSRAPHLPRTPAPRGRSRAAAEAVQAAGRPEVAEGAVAAYIEETIEPGRPSCAPRTRRVLGCAAGDVALTGSTTDGVNTVLSGLSLRRGRRDRDQRRGAPGPAGATRAGSRRRYGVSVRVVPFTELAGAVGRRTRLVACSHVSWVSGGWPTWRRCARRACRCCSTARRASARCRSTSHALGCDFYAGSGQKWLCGPGGQRLSVRAPERLDELLIPWPGYGSLADPNDALELLPAEGVRALGPRLPRRDAQRLRAGVARGASRRPDGIGCTRARPTLAARLAER